MAFPSECDGRAEASQTSTADDKAKSLRCMAWIAIVSRGPVQHVVCSETECKFTFLHAVVHFPM